VAIEALPSVAQKARALIWSDRPDSPAQQVQRAAEALNGGSDQPASKPAVSNGSAVAWVQQGVGSVLALAGHVTVVVFLVFFLLVSGRHFRERILEVAGPHLKRRRITATIIDEINSQIQRFLLVQLVTAVAVAMATTAGLAWMGVSQAAVWGILAGLFNSIPYFGPVVVSGGLVLVGLVQSGDPMLALKISAMALAITSLEGWVLNPMLMGRAERMHVVVVFLGVLLWTWIWGPWGTLLAVPMLVVLKAVADHVDSLKPVGRLMAP